MCLPHCLPVLFAMILLSRCLQDSDADQEVTYIVCLYSFQSSSQKSELRQYKSSSKRLSNNQAWVSNGGQIGRSTMGDIQGHSQEANHKNQNQKIKKQGAGKNRGRAKTKPSRQSKSLK